VFVCQTRLKLSWEVDECKPLPGGGGRGPARPPRLDPSRGGGGPMGMVACAGSIPDPSAAPSRPSTDVQGLTLVHFSAQLEPCLTQENALHTLPTPCTPPDTPSTRATQPLSAPPEPYKALKLSWKVNECQPLPTSAAHSPPPMASSCRHHDHSPSFRKRKVGQKKDGPRTPTGGDARERPEEPPPK